MEKNIFIPRLENKSKLFMTLFLFIAALISMFIGLGVTVVFLFLMHYLKLEFFSNIFTPFFALIALIAFFILLTYPVVKALMKLKTAYYTNENGDIVKCIIEVENIEKFEALGSAAMVGTILDKIVGHGSRNGFVASQGFVNIIYAISLNTKKEFVLNNIANKSIYKVVKIYKNIDNFKISDQYKNISDENENENVTESIFTPKMNIFRYIIGILLVIIAANIIIMMISFSSTEGINNKNTEISYNIGQELSDFKYISDSKGKFNFKRNNYSILSTISLNYDYNYVLKKAEVDIYWDYSENSTYIINEIKTVFEILDLEFNQSTYEEKIELLKSPKRSGYTEKIGEYKIYLTTSNSKINLRLYN